MKITYSTPSHCLYTFTAGETLTDKEGLGVTMDGASADGEVILGDAATEEIIGVITEGGASGAEVTVACVGPIVRAIAGGTVTRGKRVIIDTGDEGKFIDAVGGAAGLKGSAGIALATAADGEEFPLMLCPASNYYAS